MRKLPIIIAATLLSTATGLAAAANVEGSRDIQTYQKAAEGAVSSMPATPLVDWQALDAHTLAVWTANNKPWLVDVSPACQGLMEASAIRFTSRDNRVTAGTDELKLGDSSCKVESIRPVDYKQVAQLHHHHMKASRHMASTTKPVK